MRYFLLLCITVLLVGCALMGTVFEKVREAMCDPTVQTEPAE